ncbi:1,4-dihydroxy-2-naphthoate polyprenyltransferase [Bacillaceae bacterium Marseille-Q3522]|nr:1,4-dihydroxy-2-naphthoate polyprenyltransferase [Bacillaceae bacterium Marseille-Q3522]
MTIHAFLKLVEIRTKVASIFPFLIGIMFVIYHYESFHISNTIIFFLSMLVFDLTTTAINNYMDYRKATSNHDFNYRQERNVIGKEHIPERIVVLTILFLLAIATALGIVLVFRTGLLVLFAGILCFGIGILYTFGPIPFSRMPLGEIFSGVTMGFGILFLAVFVNAFDKGIAAVSWIGHTVTIDINIINVCQIILVSLPSVFTIANLMLANNICDIEEDIANKRFTLPFYIGKKNAIILWNVLYYLAFFDILAVGLLGITHPVVFISLLAIFPVQKNIRMFNRRQQKAETFPAAAHNLVITNGLYMVMLFISILFI